MALHMVHRNIHDEEVSEALEHENGLTVLGFKFQVISNIWVNTVCFVNPFGAVGKYIYHFFFVKFLGLEGKRNPKYFQT